MHILSFANNKGGVGKTTSALCVAHALGEQGFQVALLDCDPQANASKTFKVPTGRHHIGEVLEEKVSLAEALYRVGPNLQLVRAERSLAQQEKVFGTQPDYIFFLRDQLAGVKDVDYVVIDTPPSLAALTVASLVASEAVFVPLHPEFFGNEGMTALLDMCSRLQKNFNPKLRVGGIFFTEYASSYRRALHHQVVQQLQDDPTLGPLVMQTTIRENVALPESQSMQQSIFSWAPQSNGALDYKNLTSEILQKLK
ncbi:ParA family protein [Hymenobacter rubidus]|uniref:ParA family protein n=1 Tax=Hymenobacter rubidus TaxID=1441626 RepID=UPI00191C98A7|nr:ParA family protein [Hymenobacter rubidus]